MPDTEGKENKKNRDARRRRGFVFRVSIYFDASLALPKGASEVVTVDVWL